MSYRWINPCSLRTCCLLVLLLSSLYAYSQSPNFRNVSVDDGLLSSCTYSAVEDEIGYLWIATDKGICKFDGREFIYLNASSGLTENSYFCSRINPADKELWFISNNFKVFHGRGNSFRQLNVGLEVAWLDFDGEGRPWFLTRTGDIYYLNKGAFSWYASTALEKGHHISIQGCLKKHTIVVATAERVYLFQNRSKYILEKPVKEFETGARCRIFKRNNGTFYISFHDGLYLLNRARKLDKLAGASSEIISLYEDEKNKDVWVGTLKGLWKYNTGNFTPPNVHHYLNGIAVLYLHRTSEGILSIETQHNGLFFLASPAVHYNRKDGLLKDNILYMRQVKGKVLCIPANGDISVIYKGHAEPYRFNNRINKAGLILYVAQARDSIIIEKLTHRYCIRPDTFYALENVLPYWIYISTYYKDSAHLLQITVDHGLFDARNQLVQDATCYSSFKHLVKDKKRKHHGEILLYDPLKKIVYYTSNNGFIATTCTNGKGLVRYYPIGSDVSSLIRLNDSLLLAATYNKGLAIVKKGHTRFISIQEGLLSDLCLKLHYDGQYVWLVTAKGLTRILFRENGTIAELANFTGHDVLASHEVNDLTTIGDTIYIGTAKGVSVFNRHIRFPSNQKKPIIELVKINNIDTVVMKEYLLPYYENNIQIDYKQVSLRQGSNILYKYQLSGNDADTTFTYTQNSSINFYSLSPGSYVFSLWAKDIDGNWNSLPTQIRFVISRPFWKKPVFFVLVIMLVLISLILTLLYRSDKRNKENRIKILLKESELKALRLHMNPHFIFNTLNSLQSFVLNNNPLEANSYIVKFSRMIRWMMSYSDKHKIVLREEIELMKAYTELEQLRFEVPFVLEITISPEINPDITFIPALVIQPFVENAIKHGLTRSSRPGLLQLFFEKQGNCILVQIQDNGVGRARVKQEQMNTAHKHESTGISYTEERLNRLINNKKISEIVTITDLYEGDEAAGTRVQVLIPIIYE